MTETVSEIRVYETTEEAERKRTRLAGKEKPDHWVNNKGTEFTNPWPSFIPFMLKEAGSVRGSFFSSKADRLTLCLFGKWYNLFTKQLPPPKDILKSIEVVKPTWGVSSSNEAQSNSNKVKATWLGHACYLVELPTIPSLSRGPRILFDPVFSDRCAPVQFMGPKRYTPPPCPIQEIPEVDAVVISHNHYDHMDSPTLKVLFSRARKPHIFAPLGNEYYFDSLGCVPETHAHVLDWWDSRRVEITLPSSDSDTEAKQAKAVFDITLTPGQHQTGRGMFDRWKTLWGGWVVQPVSGEEAHGPSVYFAGDTGYRTVLPGQDEDKVPVCPAFKEIGDRWGGIDLALLPIGAYQPREIMSRVHCAPQDSVRVFQDLRAKRAVAMHWGTWVLTTEDALEPPKRLAEECKKAGIADGIFSLCKIGETVFY
ncbi:Protein-lysine N-methyltransferase efm4 [Marasmius crinis-equi]|uniref:Protein-lysine N-methyltransferase efm4 n=1 Tax=Marasmius crinis-equi TaxID=585013 RepID=A0ABR3EP71_9AGAR